MAEEKVLFHFKKQTTYNNTPENQVGAGTSTGLRTIPSPAGQVHYVRKFGTPYLITDVTDIEDPVDANMTFTVKALDGTTLGSRTGGGAFVDGSTVTAQGCYLEISASGGNVAVLNNILIDTDVDAGGLDFITAQETIYDGDTLTLYLSDTSSTYYDSAMKLGGGRHTPVVNDSRKPFFHPYDAYADAAMGSTDGVEILDSETYSFPYKDTGGTWRYELDMDHATTYLYSTDGQNPKIKGIIGPDTDRDISGLFNNATTVFFNENGTNVDTAATGYEDTWHDPYGTIANAITAAGNKGVSNIIYGGTGATVTGGSFDETITFNNINLEPEYGYLPEMKKLTYTANYIQINLQGSSSLVGWTINAQFNARWNISCSIGTQYIILNQLSNTNTDSTQSGNIGVTGVNAQGMTIEYNIINGAQRYGCYITNTTGSGTINNNIFYDCLQWAVYLTCNNNNGFSVDNNVFYSNGSSGSIYGAIRWAVAGGTNSGYIENNTIYNNFYGIVSVFTGGSITGGYRNNIVYGNSVWDLYRANNATTITESNYGTNADAPNDWTIGAGCITTDPEFCKTTLPYQLGISANSGAYRTDTSSDDMGTHFRLIEINADNLEINGIQIDGNSQFNNSIYIVDSVDHQSLDVLWCNIFNFQGIAIDLYDDDASLDAIISNNLIYSNGNGVKLVYGGNTLEENIIYNNTIFGVWIDNLAHTFNHDIIYGSQYGLYIAATAATIQIKNCIFNQNLLYGIYNANAISITATYTCVIDAVLNIDLSSATNIIGNPLFIDTTSGSENFNLKTIEQGYLFNSPCKDRSDNTTIPDIGAYDINRSPLDEWWQKYQLDKNPENMNKGIIAKSLRNIEEGLGTRILYAKAHKRILPFAWMATNAMPEAQRKTLEYMSMLIPTRENGLLKSECTFRIHLQPANYLYSSTGTVSALTITDGTQSWYTDELKGWWAGIIYTSGSATGTITASTKKLQVAPSPAWTDDEWIGYYFYYNDHYYYITDNDADELTLSDPDGTLADIAGIDWTIEKYFRITSNTGTVITVEDDDSELVAGNYSYYIDFIECRLQDSKISYIQLPRFKWTREFSKSGQNIIFEES